MKCVTWYMTRVFYMYFFFFFQIWLFVFKGRREFSISGRRSSTVEITPRNHRRFSYQLIHESADLFFFCSFTEPEGSAGRNRLMRLHVSLIWSLCRLRAAPSTVPQRSRAVVCRHLVAVARYCRLAASHANTEDHNPLKQNTSSPAEPHLWFHNMNNALIGIKTLICLMEKTPGAISRVNWIHQAWD